MRLMGSGKSLNHEVNERVREVLRGLIKIHNQTELEERLEMDQSTISAFLSGRQGTSFDRAVTICVFAGADPIQVLGLAKLDEAANLVGGPSRLQAERACQALGFGAVDVRQAADEVATRLKSNEAQDAETWWFPQIRAELARTEKVAKPARGLLPVGSATDDPQEEPAERTDVRASRRKRKVRVVAEQTSTATRRPATSGKRQGGR